MTHRVDLDLVEQIARQERPRLITPGACPGARGWPHKPGNCR
ncbi:hypothetical protein [Pseudomonas sp. RIT357]|nr:hypothetical protein [Pseudomonas sp. RIT357]